MRKDRDKILEWVRSHIDPLDIYAVYVRLVRTGKNWRALCPFHTERTPSFYVFDDRGYYCFGCKESGTVLQFIMKIENIGFRELIPFLQQRWNLPKPPFEFDTPGEKWRKELKSVLAWANTIFQECLHNMDEANEAREFLRKRGVPDEYWEKYEIGYAPAENQYLFRRVKKELDIPPGVIRECGLWRESEDAFFDFLHSRVIFPVHDSNGDVIGFTGRSIHGEEPKYLNTPDTSLFSKRRSWFGLKWAYPHLRETKTLLLVEGVFDQLLLHIHGFKNVLANLGSHLSSEQVRWIRSHTQKVFLCYDEDLAGLHASWEASRLLSVHSLEIRIVRLPEVNDPADLMLKENGVSLLRRALQEALDWKDFLPYALEREFGPQPLNHRKAREKMYEFLHTLYRTYPVLGYTVSLELGKRLRIVPPVMLNKAYQKWARKRKKHEDTLLLQTHSSVPLYEKVLIKGLVEHPAWFEAILSDCGIELFEIFKLQPVFELLYNAWYEEREISWEFVLAAFEQTEFEKELQHIRTHSPHIDEKQFREASRIALERLLRKKLKNLTEQLNRLKDEQPAQPEKKALYQERMNLMAQLHKLGNELGYHRVS